MSDLEKTMHPKFIKVLEMCIEAGINLGYNRAHKHTDDPSEDVMKTQIEQAIWNEIYEWFDFEKGSDKR